MWDFLQPADLTHPTGQAHPNHGLGTPWLWHTTQPAQDRDWWPEGITRD